MDNPIKLIYKYKNLNKRIQYQLFVYVGFLISEDLKKLLIKIEKLNFFDTLMKISLKELQLLESSYGESWYFKLFVTENLRQSFNLIDRNSQKKKDIISKFGKAWFDKNINLDLFFEKSMYSHQYLYKKEKELREREKILREKNLLKDDDDDIDYSTRRNKQSGGNNDEIDEVDDLDGEEDEEDTEVIDSNLEFDDVDEFDMEELENMYKETEIDENLKSTSELIDKIMKSDEKNITSKDKLVDFPNDKDIETYDDNIKNLNTKIFIFDQFINYDDTIKKIKEKISCSIKLNNLYNKNGTVSHMPTLSPSRLYLWSQYKYNDREDRKIKTEQIMLGQKWIKRNELLKIDVEPNENLKIYEDLKGEFNNLKQDIKKYGSRIRREEDENNLLDKYNKYIDNNEIYVIDLFNELGMNYLSSQEKLKNLFDVYIKIYFFHISSDELKQIVNYLNLKEDKNRRFEIGYMRNVYQTLKNDLIMENEIVKTVESIDISSNKNIKNMFKDNYITHSVTHVYLGHSNTYNYPNLDLFRIFDNFIMTNDCPFVQYQTDDGKMNYKFYTALEEDDENAIRSKWFENSPYGISFKIKAEQKGGSYNKYISVSLNQNGRLTYKIQWKEEDMATVEDIKSTYSYIKKLIQKINSENTKLKIDIPKDEEFSYAFINSIQKFEFEGKKSINHNDLSDFCRYFYPYVSLVIEPRKRSSKNREETKGKFGTYLRYKKVDKFENEAKIEHRIIYFMKNYEYTDVTLTKEIAKQFNITDKQALEKIEMVRSKYPVVKKSRKVLKKFETAPKYNQPGIQVDIQGKSRKNYKIRISGAKNKSQLDRIIKFTNILIFLYIQTYLDKKKEYQKIKDKLKELVNVAKRRNKVDDIVNLDDIEIKTVKKITKFDSKRLGFRPEEGESHWSRSCQNSGKKRRQPQQFSASNIDDLLKLGYKFNTETKFYEKVVKKGSKEIVLKAVEQGNEKDRGDNIYYVCDPDDNNEYMYVGFLSKGKNPSGLCMPCCFKKDPFDSKNQAKKDYNLNCIGRLENYNKETKKMSLDKIYILQDTNKIQEGRFGFLPPLLDYFLNNISNSKVSIKNHYLVNTNTSYYFKYGIKTSDYPFLEALSTIYNMDSNELKKIIVDLLEKDKDNIFFTSLDSGDIKSKFETREKLIYYINTNKFIDYDLVGDLLSKEGVLSMYGINYYIFEKKTKQVKKELEKKKIQDDYNLICSRFENDIYRTDEERDNIILMKDGKNYYPIFNIEKQKSSDTPVILKTYKYDDVIKRCFNFYNLGCNKKNSNEFLKGINLSIKLIHFELKKLNDPKFNVAGQYVDLRNKCRYVILKNNILVPTFPSGILHDIEIVDDIKKYSRNLKDTIDNLKLLTEKANINFLPIGILYNEVKNGKFKVISLLLENEIEIIIKQEYKKENEIKTLFNKIGKKDYVKKNISEENMIDKFIKDGTYEIDDRIKSVKVMNYDAEAYEIFRLEVSNFLKENEKVKDDIVKILDSSLDGSVKKKQLISLIYKNIDLELFNMYQKGGDKFMEVGKNKEIDYKSFLLLNKRDLCKSNLNKDQCNKNDFCIYKSNKCKFIASKINVIKFVNKLVNELLKDDMKKSEILQEENYYVSDIVDYENFTRRNNEEIIKEDVPNIDKILSQIFGEANMPILGKRKFYKGKTITEDNLENPLEKIGDIYVQNIIPDNNTVLRAFSNCYYWLKNEFLDIESRNLGFYSDLQTDLSNYFRGEVINFVLNDENKKYINDNLSKYLNSSVEQFVKDISQKNSFINNSIFEISVLSKILNLNVLIYNNFYDIIYVIEEGKVKFDKNSSASIKNKYNETYLKNSIVILYDYMFNNFRPSNIKSVFY